MKLCRTPQLEGSESPFSIGDSGTLPRLATRDHTLMMQKLMVNQTFDNMGLVNTQLIATVFAGIARHSHEGMWFRQSAEEVGSQQAVAE